MGNKLNLEFNISNFKPISENSENKLIGGFSTSSNNGVISLETISNNYHAGSGGPSNNCTSNSIPTCSPLTNVAGCKID